MESRDKAENTYCFVRISKECWEYTSQPIREDTSLGGCGYQSTSFKCSEVSRKMAILVASWIHQELCKGVGGMCWKVNVNREELCCFLAGISLPFSACLHISSLPRIRLTSGGLLSSQIIFNLSFVNTEELVSCSFLGVLPQYDVFIHMYLKCTGRFWGHSGCYPKLAYFSS